MQITKLGTFHHQEPIPLGINASQDGNYKLIAMFNGNRKQIVLSLTTGTALQVPALTLNEDYCYTIMAFDPNGASLGCFLVKVVPLLP